MFLWIKSKKKLFDPEFAKIARDEGYNDIARRLELIAVAENHYAERYQKLLKVLEDGSIFKKEEEVAIGVEVRNSS